MIKFDGETKKKIKDTILYHALPVAVFVVVFVIVYLLVRGAL